MYFLVLRIAWVQTIVRRVDHVVFDENRIHRRGVRRTIHVDRIRNCVHSVARNIPVPLSFSRRCVVHACEVGACARTRYTVKGVIKDRNVAHRARVVNETTIGCTA